MLDLTIEGTARVAPRVSAGGMHPLAFEGVFGWLHMPDGPVADAAVLLCPGLRIDGLQGYRPLRMLAAELARVGYPTLRFDYPGTGDSCAPDTELWAAWEAGAWEAAERLRAWSGATRLVLCGFRLGAAIAGAVAARRDDVSALILLAPVLRGRSYVRQLAIEDGSHDAGGRGLPPETLERIAAVDLRRMRPPAGCRIVVHSPADTPALAECVAAWTAHGARVEAQDFAGFEPLLRPSFMNHEAPARTERIATWLREAVSVGPVVGAPTALPDAMLRPAGCIETPLRFGGDATLFGMLCRPAGGRDTELAVVIGNSSGDPHHGPARGSVELARRLAASGIASLRIDFAGLGDSVAPGDAGTHVFEADRRPDFRAAIDALQALGYRRFAVHGLCSGAYHALQASLADERIGSVLLVNLPLLRWIPGFPIEFLEHTAETPSHMLQKFRSPDFWRRLLRAELHLRGCLAGPRTWLARRLQRVARGLAERLHLPPPSASPRAEMRRLVQRARVMMVFAPEDFGLAALAEEFGPGRAPPGATLRVLPGIDHALSARAMQLTVAETLVAFLEG
jgi:alpha-beta hydrolase superfamily lysophospholipase